MAAFLTSLGGRFGTLVYMLCDKVCSIPLQKSASGGVGRGARALPTVCSRAATRIAREHHPMRPSCLAVLVAELLLSFLPFFYYPFELALQSFLWVAVAGTDRRRRILYRCGLMQTVHHGPDSVVAQPPDVTLVHSRESPGW